MRSPNRGQYLLGHPGRARLQCPAQESAGICCDLHGLRPRCFRLVRPIDQAGQHTIRIGLHDEENPQVRVIYLGRMRLGKQSLLGTCQLKARQARQHNRSNRVYQGRNTGLTHLRRLNRGHPTSLGPAPPQCGRIWRPASVRRTNHHVIHRHASGKARRARTTSS